jgi:hypothetical protein
MYTFNCIFAQLLYNICKPQYQLYCVLNNSGGELRGGLGGVVWVQIGLWDGQVVVGAHLSDPRQLAEDNTERMIHRSDRQVKILAT